MKRKHLDFSDYKNKVLLQDRRLKAEYERLQPEFAVIEAILKARRQKGLTQRVLAKKMGTKQSAISRLETGKANPSLGFLQRLARVLDSRLEIHLAANS